MKVENLNFKTIGCRDPEILMCDQLRRSLYLRLYLSSIRNELHINGYKWRRKEYKDESK